MAILERLHSIAKKKKNRTQVVLQVTKHLNAPLRKEKPDTIKKSLSMCGKKKLLLCVNDFISDLDRVAVAAPSWLCFKFGFL